MVGARLAARLRHGLADERKERLTLKLVTVADADTIGRHVAHHVAHELPDVRSITWAARDL